MDSAPSDGRGAQPAEPDRAGVEDVAREDRQERDRAAEEDGEEIERDGGEEDRHAPDVGEAGVRLLGGVRLGRRRRADHREAREDATKMRTTTAAAR